MTEDLEKTKQWSMLIHFSQFSWFIFPLAGLIAPILIWQLKKDELPGIDQHGKTVSNWAISAFIYLIIISPVLLSVEIGELQDVEIGLILLLILAGCMIVFPIIGGIQAKNGKLWRYPLSIPFFR